ncbi:hypothetical protein NDU88_004693 [Pleurodeles waltl]|uniref:Uncharacterized protein n=1 Tax=Pleurodeles waltl TaxID=8319 RepID=A0AAV7KYH6_PLEWA|nr:hypothetical protein NDU88_004693 [Pleurodeles waltl]
MGPSSAGAAPAQRQAAPSRSRPRLCVRDGGVPRHPKNTSQLSPETPDYLQTVSPRAPGLRHVVSGEIFRGRCGALSIASAPAAILAPPHQGVLHDRVADTCFVSDERLLKDIYSTTTGIFQDTINEELELIFLL